MAPKGKKLKDVEAEKEDGYEEIAPESSEERVLRYMNRQDFNTRPELKLALASVLATQAALHAILFKLKKALPDAVPYVMEAIGVSEPLTQSIYSGLNVIVGGSSYSLKSHNAKAYEMFLLLAMGDREGALRSYLDFPPDAPENIHQIAKDAGLLEGNASVSTSTLN